MVDEITKEIETLAGNRGSVLGTGGMITKINAAKLVTQNGIDMIIANGRNPEILYDIINGEGICTRFMGKKK